MFNHVSRRFVLTGLGAATIAGPAIGGGPKKSLRPQMRNGKPPMRVDAGVGALIQAAGLSGAVACAVADVKTGRVLEAFNGNTGLPPASVAKALTTLYALEVLGAEYRFTTRIMTTGRVQNGILTGDVILAGGGDPTLTTDDLATMAAGLKSAGIREVRGAFRVFDGFLPYVHSIDAQQPDQLGYSPAVSGIALNYNRVHFEWKRGVNGYAVSMDARTKRYRPAVQMARMKVVNRRVPVYTYADRNGADHWTVARQALGNKGARWLPVRKPALYVGDVFRTLARTQGIVLSAPKTDRALSKKAQTVVRHNSAALRVIIKGMLKYSNNLTAEMVGMTASAARGGKPASLKVSALRMSRWAGQRYGMTGTRMVDHSGLGDASRMAPA
ncbi:MAG: D-alanyl-D-alanine carboxypeptidase/D-alanyl-D-alanine-endopeptidase, partial [Rhodobacteraceae bacterium]|nr:D-alanyl-D-alanine carboxypeptidase/D-alanyl-D-alanine-endopeptidase [Paracoccaceae bacterium]